VKLPKFVGKDKDNVLVWIHVIELALMTHNVPEHLKVTNVVPLLINNAEAFYFKIYVESGHVSIWPELLQVLIQDYENAMTQWELLSSKMQNIQFFSHSRMAGFCNEFRQAESHIYNMSFANRVY
jgi:hypothetical protein